MKLPKKIVIESFAFPLSSNPHQLTETVLREETYEIHIMHTPVFKAHLIPEHLEEYAYGRLFAEGIINSPKDITHLRICDLNRFHIQLKDEINQKIHGTGGLYDYINTLPVQKWGDIVSIRSLLAYTADDLKQTVLSVLNNDMVRALSNRVYYAAHIIDGEIAQLAYDIHSVSTIDKLCGMIGLSALEGLVVTNCPPSAETIGRLYNMKLPIGVFSHFPTNGALLLAKKAGITLISKDTSGSWLTFADTARRIRNS